jgi:tetratricopeptide (TPR) repeat protein
MTLGLARARQAEYSDGADRLVYLAAATRHLTDAARAGVPSDQQATLYFQLARCLHARNQFTESILLLRQSLVDYPHGRVEALRLLTLAYLNALHLDLEQAYEANAQLLRAPGLDAESLVWGWSIRRDIMRQLGKPDLLADIEAGAGDQRWAGTMARACDYFVDKDHATAVQLFTELVRLKGLAAPVERRIWYLLALAAREDGDPETASRALRQLEWRHPESPEAYAGAAFHAAILLSQGHYDEALVCLSRAARAPELPPADALPLEGPSLAPLLSTAINRLRQRQQYEQALVLADTYRRVSDALSADQLAVQLYEAWADSRLRKALELPVDEANQERYAAEELYRKAASLCLRIADAVSPGQESNRQQSNRWVWQAANDFVQGRGYLQAVAAVERLLDSDIPGELRAPAFALLCSALENSGKVELVPEVAQQCILEFPQHPATAAARYHLARYHLGFGQFDQAESQLRQCLDGAQVDADPQILEQSQLALAHLLYDQGREDEAIARLDELIAATTDRESRFDARLLLGECLHRRAYRPAVRAAESQTEHARSHYQNRKHADLEQALKVFSALQRELSGLDRSGQLSDLQWDWLRRCRWGMADCLYEADHVEEALELYKLLAEAYTEPTDWFPAQLQIANCHVRLSRVDTAVAVMRAAHLRLAELPVDDREQARVGMAPEKWKDWLEWSNRM